MGKDKLRKFNEVHHLPNCFEYDKSMKGQWSTYFKNDNSIQLELACGKGEYTVFFGRNNDQRNFIGVDIKGNRLWRGAKTAHEEELNNIAFLRTEINFIEEYFQKDEVSDIWIVFPDPQPKKERKRLTHPWFLNKYKKFLKHNGSINLKTDDDDFFEFTLETIQQQPALTLQEFSRNVYKDYNPEHPLCAVQTYYEKKWLAQEKLIKFVSFHLSQDKELIL